MNKQSPTKDMQELLALKESGQLDYTTQSPVL